MAKKRRLRAKNRMGVVVPYDIAANDVTMGNGNSVESDIAGIKQAIRMLHGTLGNYAFPGGKPDINFDGGGGGGSESQSAEIAYSLGQKVTAQGAGNLINMYDELTIQLGTNDNLYVIDPSTVRVTMAFVEQQGVYDEETDTIHIAVVTGDIEIEADAMTYIDGGYLAFQLDCKNRGGQARHWIDLIGNIDFALTDVIEEDDGMVFNGTTSKGVASGSLDVYYYNNTYGSATIEAVVDMSSFTPSTGQRLPILANTLDGRVAASFRTTSSGEQLIGCATNTTGVDDPNNNTGFFFTKNNKSFGTTGGTDGGIVVVDGNVPENTRVNTTPGQESDVHDFGAGLSSSFAVGYGNISSTNCYFKGKILAIRVYKTKLTAEQIKANYKIDKKRFNLA